MKSCAWIRLGVGEEEGTLLRDRQQADLLPRRKEQSNTATSFTFNEKIKVMLCAGEGSCKNLIIKINLLNIVVV